MGQEFPQGSPNPHHGPDLHLMEGRRHHPRLLDGEFQITGLRRRGGDPDRGFPLISLLTWTHIRRISRAYIIMGGVANGAEE